MKTLNFCVLIFVMFSSTIAIGQIGRRIGVVAYHHATVGTTAQAAIASASVSRDTKGWRICHDGGSANAYLAISTGSDPDTDGVRVAANTCFVCDECGSTALINARVKGSASSTGYSVLQLQ